MSVETGDTSTSQEGFLGISKLAGIPVLEIIPPPDHFQAGHSPSGPYISTPGARKLQTGEIHEALRRFRQQDWGELVSRHDHAVNDRNFRTREGPVLACYGEEENKPPGRVWIHLGRHAPHPTVMLPEEY